MKKLKLKIQKLINPEVLTHQQLKNVMGGYNALTVDRFCNTGSATIICYDLGKHQEIAATNCNLNILEACLSAKFDMTVSYSCICNSPNT